MDGFTNLTSIIDNALKQTAEDSGMLLGQELTIGEADIIATNRATYFCDLDEVCFVAEVTASGEYPGTFHLVFGLRDAICMSGFLLGIPSARINEKRRLAIMETDDADAFSEIINQAIGSFNTVFQPAFENKVHLKVVPPKKFVPETTEITDTEPIPDGEYLMFRARMEMPGLEMGNFDILMPRGLAELFDPPAEEPEPVPEDSGSDSEEGDEAAAAEEEFVATPVVAPVAEEGEAASAVVESCARRVLILEDDETDRQMVRELLETRGFELVEARLDADIREIFSQGGVRLVVLGIHNNDDRDMSLCIKIKAIAQGETLPIIMCAREWTRTAVLKAVRYGARDIILKPYQEDDVLAKVEKFLNAA
ncbi:response regulator receiver protein [Geobacter metallireducens RCH3]|uniref:Response regulator n=1 Tax=Geobacter metallireducens (strain ATCC 53774 / DSM 7210 / GS-15) TaxID=269799 RepID=Q39QZ3_GEOMG|nr:MULTISPECIES: response regulator [Geobacter]ABB33331.1 response regulator [Geobacter metallireducens GS-15]EHP84722.1 response regulator receiver protein [Geobacter metallireducens RCH3]MBT1074834.1 response regulator [Geobacter grbiciae]